MSPEDMVVWWGQTMVNTQPPQKMFSDSLENVLSMLNGMLIRLGVAYGNVDMDQYIRLMASISYTMGVAAYKLNEKGEYPDLSEQKSVDIMDNEQSWEERPQEYSQPKEPQWGSDQPPAWGRNNVT
ncbi:MAG: hypothetical protein AMS18_00405 [Gemmatimonas sp. SG8_17]|nr:MAG: hypothetical protein AMS18_00405 [Gemmatimonas sp. SG8_17]